MSKNKIKLTICGIPCNLLSDDAESYVHAVGEEVEDSIKTLMAQNESISLNTAALITTLSFCDELHKSTETADNLRVQIKEYMNEAAENRSKCEKYLAEIKDLQEQIDSLRSELEKAKETANDIQIQQTVPLRRIPDPAENIQKGNFINPLKQSELPDQKGFISFFEKDHESNA